MTPNMSERNTSATPRSGGRLAILTLCGLLILLLAAKAAHHVAADELLPRAYFPLVSRDFQPTWQWYAPLTPTLTPAPNHVILVVDKASQVHLLWDVSAFNQTHFIYHSYANIKAAGPWTPPAVVAASLGESTLLHPPVPGPDGALHLLWHNLAEPNHQYRLLYAVFRQGAWSPHEVAYQAEGSLDGMVRADSTGRVTATIVDGSAIFSNKIVQVARQGDVIWSAAQPITRSYPFAPAVVWPDFSSGVHLYEQASSATPPLLYHAYWHNGVFSTRDQPVVARVFGRDTQLDALGNLHVFWKDLTAIPGQNITALYHQCLENSAQSLPAEIPSGELVVSEYTWAGDTGGRFALAWRDKSDALRLGVWQGCTRQVIRSVPLPAGTGWQLRALALNTAPDMACVLLAQASYPPRYAVVCGAMN